MNLLLALCIFNEVGDTVADSLPMPKPIAYGFYCLVQLLLTKKSSYMSKNYWMNLAGDGLASVKISICSAALSVAANAAIL